MGVLVGRKTQPRLRETLWPRRTYQVRNGLSKRKKNRPFCEPEPMFLWLDRRRWDLMGLITGVFQERRQEPEETGVPGGRNSPDKSRGTGPFLLPPLQDCEATAPPGEPLERRVGLVCPAWLWRVWAAGTPGLGQPLSLAPGCPSKSPMAAFLAPCLLAGVREGSVRPSLGRRWGMWSLASPVGIGITGADAGASLPAPGLDGAWPTSF